MFCVRNALLFLTLTACGSGASQHAAPSVPANPIRGESPLCQAVLDHFVGLPGLDSADGEAATPMQDRASAGRWWIRSCSTERSASGVRVRLGGPGWYFVDQREADFAIRQQVSFALGVTIDTEPHLTAQAGVAALWLEPKATPQIKLQLTSPLHVRPTSAWGKFLAFAPVISVKDMASERLSAQAVDALKMALGDGATATYDLKGAQPDVTLGRLRPGETPRRAFADGVPWLVNERLSLPALGTHVVGPITPGPTRLDARIEEGSGLTFRVVCADEMASDFKTIANGDASRLPPGSQPINGIFDGVGPHSATFSVDGCNFFVVVSGRGNVTTTAALRVRG
jgi:hypothetical protein